MNLGLSRVIAAANEELKPIHQLGAIKWIDENYDNAWFKAARRFEDAVVKAIETNDQRLAEYERDLYIATFKTLIRRYTDEKTNDKAGSLLRKLKERDNDEGKQIWG